MRVSPLPPSITTTTMPPLSVTATSCITCRIWPESFSSKTSKCRSSGMASLHSLRVFCQGNESVHDIRACQDRKVTRHMAVIRKSQGHEHATKVNARLMAAFTGVLASSPLLSIMDSDSAHAKAVDVEVTAQTATHLAGPVFEMADLNAETAQILAAILAPIFTGLSILFVVRIVMSWYPQLPVKEFPYVIAFAPTEPVLGPTRRLLPPVGGVDVAPVVWLFIVTFANELLLGQQGLLVLLSEKI